MGKVRVSPYGATPATCRLAPSFLFFPAITAAVSRAFAKTRRLCGVIRFVSLGSFMVGGWGGWLDRVFSLVASPCSWC